MIDHTKIRPIGNRVLIEVKAKVEQKTKGGLYVVESMQKERQPSFGTILAIGGGSKVKKSGLQAGTKVVYNKYRQGQIVHENNDTRYCIVELEDVLCVDGK